MKKNGGARTPVTRVTRAPGNTTTSPRESWRMWIMTLLGLGFALLVITLLSKENKMLLADLQNVKNTLSANSESQIFTNQAMEKLPAQQLHSGECGNNVGECLMYVGDAYYPQGLGVVEGYYEAYETTDWDGNVVTCDAFVITDGSATLLEGFGKLADAGSGYIPRTPEGGFLVNINFEDMVANMTDEEAAAILASTESDQAELHVFVYQPADAGAGMCQSPFAVLEVE